MRPLKKIKMNRYIKAFCLLSFAAIIASCKKDDDNAVAPPRDYAVQYGTEKPQIEEYLKTHFIASVSEDFDIVIGNIMPGDQHVSLWDRQQNTPDYPLIKREVSLNGVVYDVYYLILAEGIGETPTRYDNVRISYRGWRLDDNQFDYDPFPQGFLPLSGVIEGWQEIIPLFKTGVYDNTPSPDPAEFTDFGAGVMFLPSDLGYYELSRPNIPSYSPLVFSFKLYEMQTADSDGDGLPDKYETENGIALADYDTDNDGTPNYIDTDDDNDGYLTRNEISIYDENGNATGVLSFEQIPTCTGGSVKRHLDPSCNQEFGSN